MKRLSKEERAENLNRLNIKSLEAKKAGDKKEYERLRNIIRVKAFLWGMSFQRHSRKKKNTKLEQ